MGSTSEVPATGARERSASPGGGIFVVGESAGKRFNSLVTELAESGIPVSVTCRVLKLARQPYYRWLADPITDSEVEEAYRDDLRVRA